LVVYIVVLVEARSHKHQVTACIFGENLRATYPTIKACEHVSLRKP